MAIRYTTGRGGVDIPELNAVPVRTVDTFHDASGNAVTRDYNLERDKVERRRRIAELLQAQSMDQGNVARLNADAALLRRQAVEGGPGGTFFQNAAGTFYAPSKNEGLHGAVSSIGKALIARRLSKKAEEEQSALDAQRRIDEDAWFNELPMVGQDQPAEVEGAGVLAPDVLAQRQREAQAETDRANQQALAAHLLRGRRIPGAASEVASQLLTQQFAPSPKERQWIDLGNERILVDNQGNIYQRFDKGESEAQRLSREDRIDRAAEARALQEQMAADRLEQQRAMQEQAAQLRQEQFQYRQEQDAQKRQEQFRQDEGGYKAVNSEVQSIADLVTQIATDPNLPKAIGPVQGPLTGTRRGVLGENRNLAQAAAATAAGVGEVQSNIANLRARITREAFKNMRREAGAIGSITEREWPLIENAVASLDPDNEQAFMTGLAQILEWANRTQQSAYDAYATQYGEDFTNKYGRPVPFALPGQGQEQAAQPAADDPVEQYLRSKGL